MLYIVYLKFSFKCSVFSYLFFLIIQKIAQFKENYVCPRRIQNNLSRCFEIYSISIFIIFLHHIGMQIIVSSILNKKN